MQLSQILIFKRKKNLINGNGSMRLMKKLHALSYIE